MPEIVFNDKKKDLPVNQLHFLFMSAGWCKSAETQEMISNFNLPFINSTLVISAWHEGRLVGVVRVLSDKVIRSAVYDLVVDPKFRCRGIGKELLERCVRKFPKTEWIVQTNDENVKYYLKNGFIRYPGNVLFRPSVWDPEY
ncbi:ribosomal protein S18 acetylase RimI-like enzyme [Methanomicrobium sp. W14]|uniref:GNAT family N-acetyltransferase n=1 Tax=Methanomicrobium sp. W14 TaxID=2817839 RepID=UPI001AE2C2A8|nr:GNAT family N-acetyltransferase [Methanomicrobium sp. W14]MBP2132256.1 ribosomal protein S18 acetylase RimI-like enzyme [Methanomicrobium sp. W14]